MSFKPDQKNQVKIAKMTEISGVRIPHRVTGLHTTSKEWLMQASNPGIGGSS